jgi:hypothetical protein
MMLGNDIVDLDHSDTRDGGLSPRFDLRVFTPAERELVSSVGNPGGVSGRVWRWRLWSAKEAAYKAARKRDATTLWSPVRFEVRIDPQRVLVDHQTGSTPVRWIEGPATSTGDPEWVHAVCGDRGRVDCVILGVGHVDTRDPSDAVRALACASVAAAAERFCLDSSTAWVRTTKRIPEMHLTSTIHDLSLSHHGRFAAFACDLGPQAERARREAA